jgi:hypothetical protein
MVTVCIDTTGIIYSWMYAMTVNVTGSFFLTTLVIALFLIAFCMFFKIPVEFTAIILLPIHLAFLACVGADWLSIGGTLLIYLGILLGKNFFFR